MAAPVLAEEDPTPPVTEETPAVDEEKPANDQSDEPKVSLYNFVSTSIHYVV